MAELSQADKEQLVRQLVDTLGQATTTPTSPGAVAARPRWRIIIIIVIEFLQVMQHHIGDDDSLSM